MKCYGLSDKGLTRNDNQDSYVIATSECGDILAIVCDGIGGAKAGDIASNMTVDYFFKEFSEHTGFIDNNDVTKWVTYHLNKCNEKIYSLASRNPDYKGMGTTFAAVLLTRIGKFIINVGDSRVYGLNYDNVFKQITVDHSLVNDMLKNKEITLEQAKNHPQRNVLTNALGVWSSVQIDITPLKMPIKLFLICSDGLHGYVDDLRIEDTVLDKSINTTLKIRKLLNLALREGGYDNITIVILELEKGDNR